jgi:peroxiredoxin (alkyl hydroperoxide reductase subunit C)
VIEEVLQMTDVAIGQEAPDFTLRNENNQEVKLSDLRGKPVVLVFYPLDFSPMCTSEMCAIRDDFSGFEEKGAQVFGISRDSVWTHKAFKEKEGMRHSLLADMRGDVARLYGAWNEAVGLAERMTVVIDGQGVVQYVRHNGLAEPRDQKEAIAAIT